MRADQYITPVERTVQQLLSQIEQLPNEVLYREPAPGEWPVMSTLAHLEELLPFWAQEAADLAANPGKPVGRTHEDPRRVGPIEQHAHDSLADIVPRIRTALAECVRILRSVPDAGWDATGQHIRTGDDGGPAGAVISGSPHGGARRADSIDAGHAARREDLTVLLLF